MPIFPTDLEETGSAEVGNGLSPNVQTAGGATNLVITRRFKVNSQKYQNYLFQLLNPAAGYYQDKKYNTSATNPTQTPAYLVGQHVSPLDESNCTLTCIFAQVPTVYDEYNFGAETFPGVSLSSLYTPADFLFRSAPISIRTQIRINHTYYLGNPTGIPTYKLFNPLTIQGIRTNQITDQTTPSADEYIAQSMGGQELVMDSSVLPWKGDIWECRTTFALAK